MVSLWKFIHNALVHGLLMCWPWEPKWVCRLHDWTAMKQEESLTLQMFDPGRNLTLHTLEKVVGLLGYSVHVCCHERPKRASKKGEGNG